MSRCGSRKPVVRLCRRCNQVVQIQGANFKNVNGYYYHKVCPKKKEVKNASKNLQD